MPVWCVVEYGGNSYEVEAENLYHRDGSLIFTEDAAQPAEITVAVASGTWQRCFRKDMLPPKPFCTE